MQTLCDSSFKVQLIIKTLCDLTNKDFIDRISAFQTKIRLHSVQLLLSFKERQNTLSAFFTGKTSTSDILPPSIPWKLSRTLAIYQQAGFNYNWWTLSSMKLVEINWYNYQHSSFLFSPVELCKIYLIKNRKSLTLAMSNVRIFVIYRPLTVSAVI